MSSWAAKSIDRRVSASTDETDSAVRVESLTSRSYVHTTSCRTLVCVSRAGVDLNALSVDDIVAAIASRAQSQIIDSLTVCWLLNTVTLNRDLVNLTDLSSEKTSACKIEVPSADTSLTVTCHQVDIGTVDLSVNTRTKSKSFSFFASS